MSTSLHARRLRLVLAGAALVAGGLIAHAVQPDDPTLSARIGTPGPSGATDETLSPPARSGTDVVQVPSAPGTPRRVVIPDLEVEAAVLPIEAPAGVLVPPTDPQKLGWWADGARPGAARGSALVTGHTLHAGGGALDDLETLHRGDPVRVRTSNGWLSYAVTEVVVDDKGTVARDAQRLFSQDVRGRLVLITCEDWDGERYLSNVVVFATPRNAPPSTSLAK